LKLQHPITGEFIEAIAPLPDEFNTLLKILRLRANI
jgi:23S rRNA pseudouridine1911/1915/1917 synthase